MDSDFRVFAEDTTKGTIFSIHEVFYGPDNKPEDYIHIPIILIHTDEDDLVVDLQKSLEAWERPILSMNNFPEEW